MNLDTLRALSVRRPWAELIMAGVKPVENRSRYTHYRGMFVVHAGNAYDPRAVVLAAKLGVQWECDPRDTPTGYLGMAAIADAHIADDCDPWGELAGYHWAIESPRRFPRVIAGGGKLGWFRPAPAVLDMLRGVA